MKQKNGLVKSTLLITFCSLFGIVISFISQMIIAYYFGAKFERDAYFIAGSIPTYLSAIVIGSVGVIFLPKVVDVKNNNNSELSEFLSTVLFSLTIFSIVLGGLCVFFSKSIIGFIATGFNLQQILFTSKILVIVLPTFIISILSSLLTSLYQIENRFFYPAFAPIITSVISLIFVVFFSEKIGIFGLAFGFLAGSIASLMYLIPVLKTYKVKMLICWNSPLFISFIRTFIPLLIAGVLFRSTSIFERSIASNLEVGSVSYLGYSSQVLAILATVTSSGIGISIYPKLSELWTEKKNNEFNLFFTKIVRVILLISLPISLLVIFFGDMGVKLIFERGAFNHNVTIAVSNALAWSMGAFIFQNLGNVVSKIFYISGKTSVISIIGSLELLLYISLGYYLSHYFSYVGLAIALSLSSSLNIILAILFIDLRLIKIKFRILFIDSLKVLLSSCLSVFVVYLLYYYIIKIEGLQYMIISLFFGLITFILSGVYTGIEEVLYLKNKLYNR
jgi:putative peptidoglycan lipid II flippase